MSISCRKAARESMEMRIFGFGGLMGIVLERALGVISDWI